MTRLHVLGMNHSSVWKEWTDMHAYIHTCIYTYMHTCIHIYLQQTKQSDWLPNMKIV